MRRLLVILLCAISLVGCAGGGGSVGGGGSLTMDPVIRSAAISKVEEKQYELLATSGLSMAQRCSQMADYLKTLPEFKNAGVSPDLCAWGTFTDGGNLVVSFNRMPDWRGTGSPGGAGGKPPMASVISKSANARVLHSFGQGFDDGDTATTSIKAMLTKGGYSVRATNDGEASVQQLRTVNADGYFYFNTHGGSFEDALVTKRFCMQTSTVRSNQLDTQFDIAADIAAVRLVWFTAPNGLRKNGKAVSDTRYAITADFVKAYWKFDANAIAFFNVCYSSYTAAPNGAQDFIKACQDAGAGVHFGWDNSVSVKGSIAAARFFVDRLVGTNEYNAENPKQRPFLAKEILADMKAKAIVPVENVNLVASFKSGVTNVGLRPTIEYLSMQEQLGKLDIHGQFGNEKGQVFVEGVEAANVQWTEDLITCEIPSQGNGSFGDVWVKVNGKESNRRQLSMFSGSFTYTETGEGTLKCTINGTLKIRQDLAWRRKKPGGALTNPDPIPFFAAPGSTCTFNATGEHRDGNNKLIQGWAGGGAMTLTSTPVTGPAPQWSANGAFYPATEEFLVAVVAGGPKEISGQVGNTQVAAGTLGRNSQLNLGSWTVAPYAVTGNPAWSFSAMTPQKPPVSDLLYHPSK